MSFILIALQVTGLGATNYGVDAPMTAPVSAPSFADEFEEGEVDRAIWRYDASRNAQGWHNNELQYYAVARPENARIENGALIIEARREAMSRSMFADWGGQGYSSAKLVSRGALGYGFYEVRAKLPCGRGAWPAIWMLPEGGSWPEMGEIDIMEMVGWDPNVIHATLHSGTFNHAKGTQRGAQKRVEAACKVFHNYQLDWRPDSITIGIDGHAHMQVTKVSPSDKGAWPFDKPFHLILNLAVGGDWGGKKGVDDKALPMRMSVEYVRHWPLEATASTEP